MGPVNWLKINRCKQQQANKQLLIVKGYSSREGITEWEYTKIANLMHGQGADCFYI